MASNVAETPSLLISPSCSVNLFLFPGFKITTLSLPLYLKIYPHFFSIDAFNHMNFIFAPRSIFLSYFAFRASNTVTIYFDGFYFVSRIVQRVDSVPKQISLALLACISGTILHHFLHIYVIHCFVADESRELPPPGTNTSEYIFKNSNSSSKLNYFPLKKIGFFYPVFTTITEGNFFTAYFATKTLSLLLTSPKFSFFSNATLNPL